MKRWLFIALIGLLPGIAARAAQVGLIKIDGAIGPATASYISRALDIAAAQSDECLIIQLDTPGGLLESTKQIVQKFYAAKVPTVVYVSPASAHGGQRGRFHHAGGGRGGDGAAHQHRRGASGGTWAAAAKVEKTDNVMKQKIENDTASFTKTIADKRHRNADWAKSAVIESASITARRSAGHERD